MTSTHALTQLFRTALVHKLQSFHVEFLKTHLSEMKTPNFKLLNYYACVCVQMRHGVDTAKSWHPSGRSWAKSMLTTMTSSSPRWTPQPMKLTLWPLMDSQQSNTFQPVTKRYSLMLPSQTYQIVITNLTSPTASLILTLLPPAGR